MDIPTAISVFLKAFSGESRSQKDIASALKDIGPALTGIAFSIIDAADPDCVQAARHVKNAMIDLSAGVLDVALKNLKEAEEKQPTNVGLWLGYAILHWKNALETERRIDLGAAPETTACITKARLYLTDDKSLPAPASISAHVTLLIVAVHFDEEETVDALLRSLAARLARLPEVSGDVIEKFEILLSPLLVKHGEAWSALDDSKLNFIEIELAELRRQALWNHFANKPCDVSAFSKFRHRVAYTANPEASEMVETNIRFAVSLNEYTGRLGQGNITYYGIIKFQERVLSLFQIFRLIWTLSIVVLGIYILSLIITSQAIVVDFFQALFVVAIFSAFFCMLTLSIVCWVTRKLVSFAMSRRAIDASKNLEQHMSGYFDLLDQKGCAIRADLAAFGKKVVEDFGRSVEEPIILKEERTDPFSLDSFLSLTPQIESASDAATNSREATG